ncbi:MAG: threonylcarbamoyl-AMP synthase [Bacteroidales bacterium]|nr:threonylcarbamoyl-AMP synthase [Bacteroidales bacterium]
MTSTNKEIEIAAQLIRDGKVVAFPTETVYGLGANALNAMAVARIYELKERPSFDPLIVHIADIEAIRQLTTTSDERVQLLADRFWPGPLTIILPKSEIVPDIVTSGLGTVGIRMPANPVARELIRRAGCPIAAPSANKFGQLSPTLARHVAKQLPDADFILDGGPADVGIESTIIALNEKGFEILRHGVITREDIETLVPYYALPEEEKTNIVSPGMLKSHYSPGKPLYILGTSVPPPADRSRVGLLSFKGHDTAGYAHVEILSEKGDLKACAVNLFAAIHRLEDSEVEYIVAQPVPEEGVGLAVMDKLRKAAYRYL